MDTAAIAALAADLLGARASGRQMDSPSTRPPGMDLDAGRAVAVEIRRLRAAQGERPVGRKIGFTNRTIWDLYGVHAPIWGDVWDTTLHRLDAPAARLSLPALTEPRLEPEIVVGFHSAPLPDMDAAALMDCVDWVAHGVEIVFSPFPGWKFAAADCQAGFGLHGALYVGPPVPVADLGPDPAGALAGLTLTLHGPQRLLTGRGTDVLDGPASALRHLVAELARAGETPLAAGDVVTTGTLTDAVPVAAGDRWRTQIEGCPLPGLDLTFT